MPLRVKASGHIRDTSGCPSHLHKRGPTASATPALAVGKGRPRAARALIESRSRSPNDVSLDLAHSVARARFPHRQRHWRRPMKSAACWFGPPLRDASRGDTGNGAILLNRSPFRRRMRSPTGHGAARHRVPRGSSSSTTHLIELAAQSARSVPLPPLPQCYASHSEPSSESHQP